MKTKSQVTGRNSKSGPFPQRQSRKAASASSRIISQLPFGDGDIATMSRCISELENIQWKVTFLLESIINSHQAWMHTGYPNEEKLDEIMAGWNLFQLEFVKELEENGTALLKTWAKCSPALTRLLAQQTANTKVA